MFSRLLYQLLTSQSSTRPSFTVVTGNLSPPPFRSTTSVRRRRQNTSFSFTQTLHLQSFFKFIFYLQIRLSFFKSKNNCLCVTGAELHPVPADAEAARVPRGVPRREPARRQPARAHAGARR